MPFFAHILDPLLYFTPTSACFLLAQYMVFCVVYFSWGFSFHDFLRGAPGGFFRGSQCVFLAWLISPQLPLYFAFLGFGGAWVVSGGVIMSFLYFPRLAYFRSSSFLSVLYCSSIWGKFLYFWPFRSTVVAIFGGFPVTFSYRKVIHFFPLFGSDRSFSGTSVQNFPWAVFFLSILREGMFK